MVTSSKTGRRGQWLRRVMWAGCSWAWLLCAVAHGQMIYQEGFNTDGDGTRYDLEGRGYQDVDGAGVGPSMWELSFLSPRIGLVSTAPAKRAAILWSDDEAEDTWSAEAIGVWDSLVGWMTDDKPQAKIGFFPGTGPESVQLLANYFQSQGHTVVDVTDETNVPGDLSLLIHTSELAPTNPTAFAALPIPLLAFDADIHDDSLIAGIGADVIFSDTVNANVVAANQGHPALGGLTGSFPWTTEVPLTPLQSIGKIPPGGRVLFNYEDPATGEDVPGLVVIDKGGGVLGSFTPQPEGAGYLVGGDLDAAFGDAINPRAVQIGPIDVSAFDDIKLTLGLAGTDADFENTDFLRIMIDPTESGVFQTLDEFIGNANKALENPAGVELKPDRFQDVTYSIPNSATNLILRIEAASTFPNEIVGIDNVRIYSGSLIQPGDVNGDGALNVADIDALCAAIQSGGTGNQFDINGDGSVNLNDQVAWVKSIKQTWIGDVDLNGEFNSADFVAVFQTGEYEDATPSNSGWSDGDWNCDGDFTSSDFVAAFQDGGYERGPLAAVRSVPEPAAGLLVALGLAGLLVASRRR